MPVLSAPVGAAQSQPPPADVGTVTVRGKKQRATTEGTRSYAPRATTVGGKAEVDPLEIPNAVSTVTRQRIEDQALTTVEQALGEVTGVSVVPNDGAQSQIRSRG